MIVQKYIHLATRKFEEDIEKCIDGAGLPYSVMRLALFNYANRLKILEDRAVEEEVIAYKAEMEEKKKAEEHDEKVCRKEESV